MNDPLEALTRLEGVSAALAAATDAVDAVLRDRGARAMTAETVARARWRSARANADREADPDAWFAGALRAAAETEALAGLVRVAPAQALARAHALVARDLASPDELGRARSDPEVTSRLRGLADLLTAPTAASAIVSAAVAHAEVASVAPFARGNGVVARVMEHAVLVDTGLDPRGVVIVEAGHLAAGPAYAELLAGYASGAPDGVRNWLLHCARAVTVGAERSPILNARPGSGVSPHQVRT